MSKSAPSTQEENTNNKRKDDENNTTYEKRQADPRDDSDAGIPGLIEELDDGEEENDDLTTEVVYTAIADTGLGGKDPIVGIEFHCVTRSALGYWLKDALSFE